MLGRSNMKDWIIFGEISMEGRYSIMINMESNQDLIVGMLRYIRKHEVTKY